MYKPGKEIETIAKKVMAAAGKDGSRGVLQGFYLEKYPENMNHGFRASITATDGHVMLSYYMTETELDMFNRFVLPHYFDNGKSVYFESPEQAENQKDADYPEYRKVLPTHIIDQSIPVMFAVREQRIATDFFKAIGIVDRHFIPNASTNFSRGGQNCGCTAQVGNNYIALIMPIHFTNQHSTLEQAWNQNILELKPVPEPETVQTTETESVTA
jgi:hypothetical protein